MPDNTAKGNRDRIGCVLQTKKAATFRALTASTIPFQQLRSLLLKKEEVGVGMTLR